LTVSGTVDTAPEKVSIEALICNVPGITKLSLDELVIDRGIMAITNALVVSDDSGSTSKTTTAEDEEAVGEDHGH